MKLIVARDYEHLSKIGAMMIAAQILLKPSIVLGLATGSTPLGTYKELIRMYNDGIVDFSRAVTFNLDEYVGLEKNDSNSYNYYMKKNFFEKVNIQREIYTYHMAFLTTAAVFAKIMSGLSFKAGGSTCSFWASGETDISVLTSRMLSLRTQPI